MNMKYPGCSNGNCMHNDKYLCKAEGLEEDIICKQGKAGEGTYKSENV